MYRIPEEVYNFFEKNPTTDATSAARFLGVPSRTMRRYRRYWMNGEAVAVTPEIKITSARMLELEEAEEDDFDVDAFLEEAPRQVQRQDRFDPVLTQDTFTFDGDKPIGIAFISCLHLGGRYTAYEEFRKVYEQILDIPRLYFLSLGDDVEGFTGYFKDRSAVQDQIIDVRHQRKVLERILEPLVVQNKLLAGFGSQHNDKWVQSNTGENPIKEMYMQTFGVPYYDGIAYIELKVGKQTYYVALGHEFPGTSQWNPVQAQKRASKFRFPMADVVAQGDKHTTAYALEASFVDEYLMNNRPSPYVLLVQSGTSKTGPDKYTVKNWPLGNFGWPVVIFYPDKHDMAVDMDLDRIRRLLDA